MSSCIVKDLTEHSRTKDKKIVLPVTVLEAPPVKIFSVRFYKDGKVTKDILAGNLDKELKRKVKLAKTSKSQNFERLIKEVNDYDDVRVIVYSNVKTTGIKKAPDLSELALSGSKEDKLKWIKENLGKEIFLSEIFKGANVVDVRGLTKGKGTQGPIKRFGIKLKQHKSEKGRRRPGTIGPWHPAHVSFRVPMAGQLGMFSRVSYNLKVMEIGKISEKDINPKAGWKNYGKIKTEYIILQGSVQGPAKRSLLLTFPLRITKKQFKKQYEVLGLR
jgi:large subunit ribosomal protein L3